MTPVHVIGAGIAGLAGAVRLTEAGRKVVLHEAAHHAGGRCRSFFDPRLERLIDNGTHLILSANPALFAFIEKVGGALQETEPASFPFHDATSGENWTIAPDPGPIPWWLFDPKRRVPKTGPLDYLSALRLVLAGSDKTVAQVVGDGPLLDRLWRPLCDAILNTAPEEGQARLLGEVLKRTLLKGEAACRAFTAPEGLSAALIDPALAWLKANGADIRLGHRLTAIEDKALVFDEDERISYSKQAPVLLALPSWTLSDLLPTMPRLEARPIVNAHFVLPHTPLALPGGQSYLGLVRGLGQWWSLRSDVLSVTVSAATKLAQEPAEAIAARIWAECALILGQSSELPPWRVMKEQRATLAHTPATEALRPMPLSGAPEGLILAGDWTATGLPCTLEGAAQSGQTAARLISSPR
jgi:squalene-associated FAD-dependent desaturase